MMVAYIHIRGLSGKADPPYTLPQEELENFPLPTVQHSQTVLNQLRYPSVLLLVCQDSDQNKPDIHFFHCDEVEVRQTARGGHDAMPVGQADLIPLCLQAELVQEDIESALADYRLGKKMRPQTLK